MSRQGLSTWSGAVGHRGAALQVLGDQVGFVVLGEVVAAHEAFLALRALEALVTCGGEWGSAGGSRRVTALVTPSPARWCPCGPKTSQNRTAGTSRVAVTLLRQVAFTPAPLCDTSVPSITQDRRDAPHTLQQISGTGRTAP